MKPRGGWLPEPKSKCRLFRSHGLASLHRKGPNVQSAIRPRPVSAPIRLTPQSAMRNMQNRFMRSELELRRPKNGI
eukprot:802306-Alexandrium_andersonii.AAC.1